MATQLDTKSSPFSRRSLVYPWLWNHDMGSRDLPELLSLQWFMHEFGDAASVCHTHAPQIRGRPTEKVLGVLLLSFLAQIQILKLLWGLLKKSEHKASVSENYLTSTSREHLQATARAPTATAGLTGLWGLCCCLSNICNYEKPLHNALE